MVPEYFNNSVKIDGKIYISIVPNSQGTILTYNEATKEISQRTNTELLSDLGLKFSHKTNFSGGLNNASDSNVNKSWFDYSWANSGFAGSVINFSGLGSGNYSTELFVDYGSGLQVGTRSKNGDTNLWNPINWLWHSRNLTQGDINNWNDAFSWGDNSKIISAYTSSSVTHDFSLIVQKNQIIECQDVPSIDFIKFFDDKIEVALFNYSSEGMQVYIEGNLIGELEPEEKVNFRFSELADKVIFYDRNPISSSL